MDDAPVAFGVMSPAKGSYRLAVRNRFSASLFELQPDGSEQHVSAAGCWPVLAEQIEADWNRRLAARSHTPGRMPRLDGAVEMHRQFGRELDVLFTVARGFLDGKEMVQLWRDATPPWRLDLWRMIVEWRPEPFRSHLVSQDIQEMLRKRSNDGSVDEEREGGINSRRDAAYDRVIAERKANPNYRPSKAVWF